MPLLGEIKSFLGTYITVHSIHPVRLQYVCLSSITSPPASVPFSTLSHSHSLCPLDPPSSCIGLSLFLTFSFSLSHSFCSLHPPAPCICPLTLSLILPTRSPPLPSLSSLPLYLSPSHTSLSSSFSNCLHKAVAPAVTELKSSPFNPPPRGVHAHSNGQQMSVCSEYLSKITYYQQNPGPLPTNPPPLHPHHHHLHHHTLTHMSLHSPDPISNSN